jgi:hypothetical protein
MYNTRFFTLTILKEKLLLLLPKPILLDDGLVVLGTIKE